MSAQEWQLAGLDIDPKAVVEQGLKGSVDRMGFDAMVEKYMGGGPAAAAPAQPIASGQPPSAEMPVPSGAAPGPAATAPAAAGGGSAVSKEMTLSFGEDGKRRLSLKFGNINYDIKHVTIKGADGKAQIWRVATNPQDVNDVQMAPVGPAVPPEETQKWMRAVEALDLKPGTDVFEAAVSDFQLIANTMQGPARDIMMTQMENYYRGQATARPAAAPAPAKPTAEGARAQARAEEVEQLTKKATAEAGVKTAAQQDAPIGDDATRYVNRRTLQHPQAGDKRRDVEGNPNLVQLSPDALKKLPQILTTKESLDRAEAVVRSSPDLWPKSSGSPSKDLGLVAGAIARWKFRAKTDPRIGEVESLKITIPGTIKLFGDSGNISEAERAFAESALGLKPSTQEQVLARLDAVRSMVNTAVEPMGLGPFPRKPGPKPAESPAAKTPGMSRFRYDDKTGRLIPVQP